MISNYSSLYFFSIHGGSSVRTYLDCHWITTQVLHKHALNVPEDTDLIIGYMFQVRTQNLHIFLPIFLQIDTFSHIRGQKRTLFKSKDITVSNERDFY